MDRSSRPLDELTHRHAAVRERYYQLIDDESENPVRHLRRRTQLSVSRAWAAPQFLRPLMISLARRNVARLERAMDRAERDLTPPK